MRSARSLIVLVFMLATAACARQSTQTYVMIDPATGQQIGVMQQPVAQSAAYVAPQPAPAMVAQAQYVPQNYGQPTYVQPQPVAPEGDRPRGLLSRPAPAPGYGAPYVAPQAAPYGYGYAAVPPGTNEPYTLDAGDRLRINVFGQEGISNTYIVDASGNVTLPLIGSVPARGHTTQALAAAITDRLKRGFVREPHVSVELEQARPFFILGEVTTPGQYPYVPNMTVETAVAIAGGFGPRASKTRVQITRNLPGQQMRGEVPLNFPLKPGDTIVVKERWF